MWNFTRTQWRRPNIYDRNLFGFFFRLFPGAFAPILYVFAFSVDGMALAWAACSANVTFAWASNPARASLKAESISWTASLPRTSWESCYAWRIFWNKLFYLINTIRRQRVKMSLLKFLIVTIYDLLGMSPGVSMNLMT